MPITYARDDERRRIVVTTIGIVDRDPPHRDRGCSGRAQPYALAQALHLDRFHPSCDRRTQCLTSMLSITCV